MKILQICNFSSGISGVWSRVFQDSKELVKKNDVFVFSSNLKNDDSVAKNKEKIEGINILRFPVKRRKGFALWFDFEKQALKLKPDIIICHGFRKPYLAQAIRIIKKLKQQGKKTKIFLVTHAPFLEKGIRSWKLDLAVKLYDKILAKKILNSFGKIIAITKWEMPYLLKLGAKKQKIIYIPNSLDETFFKLKTKKGKGVLFLGRVSPIKNLEILIKACRELRIKPTIVGPVDKGYKINAEIQKPIYDLKEKINLIDKHEIFVLPSKREGLPVSLIEALSRGKIAVSSSTQGGKEIIKHNKNGFLFEIGNYKQLAAIINKIQKMTEKEKNKIRKQARKKAEEFRVSKIIKKLEKVYSI